MSKFYKPSRRDFLKTAGGASAGLAFGGLLPGAFLRRATAQGSDRVVIWSPGDSGTVADWNTDPILQAVEAGTNTDIEMLKIDWGTFVDHVNAAAASGSLPDVIGVVDHNNRALIQSWIRDGVIAPYEGDVAAAAPNVIAQYDNNPTLNELKVDGKIYMQPISWGDGNYPNMGLLHIRRDLLEKYGMTPPDTFDEYFEFLRAAIADGRTGALFNGAGGIGSALNAFAGAHGKPVLGWTPLDDGGFGFWAIQPAIKDALLLFRGVVAEGLVDPATWSMDIGARDAYAAGQGASLIFSGGGHTGRIQNDMDLAGQGAQNWMLPAPDAGMGMRGYTTEPMFWGVSFLGGMNNNNPVAAARVINYLISDDGYRLTALGVEGEDYEIVNGEIVLLPARSERGFGTEAGDTGAHPLATTIVSWVPQGWQNWQLLYGKSEEYEAWFNQIWENQGRYQTQSYGLLSTTPEWIDFAPTGNELVSRTFLEIGNAGSDAEASAIFDQFVNDWLNFGGANAQAAMSDLLSSIYE
jgi:putative aldouronate transport system substrate-binding protein